MSQLSREMPSEATLVEILMMFNIIMKASMVKFISSKLDLL